MAAAQPAVAPAAPNRDQAYEEMRRRAQQQGTAAAQQQGEALKRRFAAIGNLNSGAYVKASQQAADAAQAQTGDAVRAVDFQKAQEDYNREMFDKDQAFKNQVFQDESKYRGINADLQQRDLAASERANQVNALLGLANADLDQVGNDPNQLNAILQRYGFGGANVSDIVRKRYNPAEHLVSYSNPYTGISPYRS